MDLEEYIYENGVEIQQIWNYWFILYAFMLAFVSAYSAVRLLDHNTWRTEKEKQNANAVIIKYPSFVAALILGFGTVWSMHFTGMSAVSLENKPMCYNWVYTIISLVCAIVFMWAGVHVASYDIFAGEDRIKNLKAILVKKPSVSQTKKSKSAKKVIYITALFCQLQWIAAGSLLAAVGAVSMHYTGMWAMSGPFRKEWDVGYVVGSVFVAIAVCFAGFWIVFRLLHWKVEQFWLRPVSAAVIASAVCGLHFFGMFSVKYIADDAHQDACYDRIIRTHGDSPNAWDDHQMVVAGVSIMVPTIALLVENMICQELLLAYANLKNPSLKSVLSSSSNSGNPKSTTKESTPVEVEEIQPPTNETISAEPVTATKEEIQSSLKNPNITSKPDLPIGKEKEAKSPQFGSILESTANESFSDVEAFNDEGMYFY